MANRHMKWLQPCIEHFAEHVDQHGIHAVSELPASLGEHQCDWLEVGDMAAWHNLIRQVPYESVLVHPDTSRYTVVPQVTVLALPLSTLVIAHHNLVTYSVPFSTPDGQWVNPGPDKVYYAPEAAIRRLAPTLDSISGDSVVSDWLSRAVLLDMGGKRPGGAVWVSIANQRFAKKPAE